MRCIAAFVRALFERVRLICVKFVLFACLVLYATHMQTYIVQLCFPTHVVAVTDVWIWHNGTRPDQMNGLDRL